MVKVKNTTDSEIDLKGFKIEAGATAEMAWSDLRNIAPMWHGDARIEVKDGDQGLSAKHRVRGQADAKVRRSGATAAKDESDGATAG